MTYKHFLGAGLILFIGAAAVMSTEPVPSGPAVEPELPSLNLTIRDRPNAFTVCRRAVKSSLKSPATAKFPYEESAFKISDTTYGANFYVDSENGFGALVRSQVFCELEKTTSDRYGYTLSRLQIQ